MGGGTPAVLPGGRAVTAFMTDADLLPTGKAGRERLWKTSPVGNDPGARRDDLAAGPLRLHAAPACTGTLSASTSADWVAVGDAARTLDPLSGQGVTEACQSAIQAAEALVDRGHTSALRALSADYAVAHRRHVLAGLRHYRRENRWPRSPFWVRRHQRFHAMS